VFVAGLMDGRATASML